MKNFLFALFISFMFSSCAKRYIQVFDTGTMNTKLSDSTWVFENDSVKITYDFWKVKGVMSFDVFNKLDNPIYIDWKSSSFIYNGNKLNYWIDESQTSMSSYYRGYYYNAPLIFPGLNKYDAVQTSSSSTFKPERITFIPPKANYNRQSGFFLMRDDYYPINVKCNSIVVSRNDKRKRKTKICFEEFTYDKSPIKFRNFLTFSFSETSQQLFFTDNEFYLSSVKEMDLKHFLGKSTGNFTSGKKHQMPFAKRTSFYKRIAATECIGYRKYYRK